jgi:hypothetical protein
MTPPLCLCFLVVTACAVDAPIDTRMQDIAGAHASIRRDALGADLAHYQIDVRIGTAPNAVLRLHRVVRELAPWQPRPTARGALLLHGDFSTFVTNFLPQLGEPASPVRGLAPYLADRDIDVWGLDRRWTLPAADGDVSDFGDIGVAQELADIERALAIAHAVHGSRLALVGFSHGGQLAYTYAAVEGARPPGQRHVDALVPIDVYAEIAPADADLRAGACEAAVFERELVASGTTDAPNDFLIAVGTLAAEAPDADSPLIPGMTNRAVMLLTLGQTYQFVPFAPFYHLAAPVLDGDVAIGLREMSEQAANAWLAGATPHQSMREAADFDTLWCGEAPLPVTASLANIRVPVWLLAAAGGFGEQALFTLTRVGSTDVGSLVVQRFGPERRAEDFGHADLLFATDAPVLAWQPLVTWLLHH